MNIKSRLRSLLSDVLVKIPVKSTRDRITNKLAIKNIISDKPGCYIRILATDNKNAKDIKTIIDKHKQELEIIDVDISNEPINYNVPKNQPLYNSSLILKLDPNRLFKYNVSRHDRDINALQKEVNDCEEKNQKIVIEYSSPNIAKPFHYGHLKSTILGNYLANLNQFLGHQVTKLNYIGDWGTQYGLLNLGLDECSQDVDYTVKNLLDIYVKANQRGRSDETFYSEAKRKFHEMSQDVNSIQYKRWKKIKDISMQELKTSYGRLGISFDIFDYESSYSMSSIELVRDMIGRKVFTQMEDGSVVANVEKNQRHIEVNLLKSDGTSLYLTRDIVAAVERMKSLNFDKMLYVVGADQEKHFHCLKEIIKQLNYDWSNKLTHVKMAKVLGMSSRSGNMVLLSDIIDEATSRFIDITKATPTSKVSESSQDTHEVARQLAISALFVYDMRHPRMTNYSFEWSEIMKSCPRSGINLQATFARLCSLMTKASEIGLDAWKLDEIDREQYDFESISCQEAFNMISLMDEFKDQLYISYWQMDPSPLVNYALRLSKAINRARRSQRLRVLGEADHMKAKTRLSLFKSGQELLETIIRLIGLNPLTRI